MQIRFLEYVIALAQEQHFARAAERCHVSQPTLSSGLAALEEQLGKRLVERDRRFVGLTAEGSAILPWAQQVVAAYAALATAAQSARGPLTGTLRFGVIPAAMPIAGTLVKSLQTVHPRLDFSFVSLSSRNILRALAAFEIDAGLTYIDHEAPTGVLNVPLYTEHLLYICSTAMVMHDADAISLVMALDRPLCLLHDGMQNRRILDQHLLGQGLRAAPRATADTYEALIAMVCSGAFATILPASYLPLLPVWAKVCEFDPPLRPAQIGLVVSERLPLSPFAQVALDVAKRISEADSKQ